MALLMRSSETLLAYMAIFKKLNTYLCPLLRELRQHTVFPLGPHKKVIYYTYWLEYQTIKQHYKDL